MTLLRGPIICGPITPYTSFLCLRMRTCFYLLVLVGLAAAARTCNETESRLFLEQSTRKDISYVQFSGVTECYVKFTDSERLWKLIICPCLPLPCPTLLPVSVTTAPVSTTVPASPATLPPIYSQTFLQSTTVPASPATLPPIYSQTFLQSDDFIPF